MIEATITTPQPHPQELETERERLQPTELTLNYKDDSGNVISSEATPLFVVGTPPSSGHGQEHKYHGVLTNDPSLFLAVYEEGPTGLDREEFADGAELFVVRGSAETIAISSVYEQLAYSYGLSVSADRMITMHFGGLHRADVAPTAANLDNSLVSADIDYGNDNNLHKIAENGDLFSSFRHGYGYREVPAIRDFYHSLGMNDPEVDDVGRVRHHRLHRWLDE